MRFALLATVAVSLSVTRSDIVGAQHPSSDSTGARVDRVFARWSSRESPGCAVAVGRDGAQVFARGYGMANLEHDIPIGAATVFETGSVAKQFTATSVVLLAQRGKLSLDDDIRKYIPELPDYGRTITIRHMLNHTSGLRDWLGLAALSGRPSGRYLWTNADVLDIVRRQKALNFEPGSEFLYSNTGYTLLALVVERVSGTSFADFARTNIFAPLGMTQTRFRDDMDRIEKGRATAYAPAGEGTSGFRASMPFMNAHGSGGLLTTVGDLLRWNDNYAAGTVGGRTLDATMRTQGRLSSGRDITYALGLTVSKYRGELEVGHGGSTAGYQTYLTRFPEQHLSVALLCNLANVNTAMVAHQVADVFLQGYATPASARSASTVTLTTQQLAPLAGLWFSDRTKELRTLTVRDGKLYQESGPELWARSPLRFVVNESLELDFENRTGAQRVMRAIAAGGDTTVFTPVTAWTPNATQLAELSGRYTSDEVETSLQVSASGGTLTVTPHHGTAASATPLFADAFRVPRLGMVRFTRDSGGRVDGLEVYAGRVRSLRFAMER